MIKKADIILGLVILIVGGLSFVFFAHTGDVGESVRISVDGEVYGVYPLDYDNEISIDKGDHHNLLVIKNGKAYMKDANCPDGYCLYQFRKNGGISRNNERIVCLPNRVIVTIEGEDHSSESPEMGGGFDAITG